MCGGRGTRLDADAEKPLVEVGGVPMLDRVAAALRDAGVAMVHAVVSPDAPATAARARELSLSVVETPGEGYVDDLDAALESVGSPAVTVAADLPLLAATHVDDAVAAARRTGTPSSPASVTVCVPAALKRRLGASVDTAFDHEGRRVAPTGVNVVADSPTDTVQLTYDARVAVNVNRPADLELAEELCG
jgi:adenosylcobinamide-phosphate guanylyltransferase